MYQVLLIECRLLSKFHLIFRPDSSQFDDDMQPKGHPIECLIFID
jgi:hypothetical protein